MRRLRAILPSLLVLAWAAPATAQVTTDIVPDGGAFATGTAVTRVGAVTTIAGGTQAGGNLFHSFASFSLGAGEAARWTATNPASVANVINRVTGGKLSTIAGTIDTTALPGADFYFINPAGVLFTAGAQLNVPGAARFSTGADGLQFVDGPRFSAVAPNGTFSMAAPESFGFLGGERGVVIDGVGIGFTSAGTGLFLTASNIGIQAPGFAVRNLDLVTTGGSAVRILLSDPLGSAPLAGETLLVGTQIFGFGTGARTPAIRVATGNFTQVGGVLSSTTFSDADAGDLFLRARSADITGVVSSDTAFKAGNAGAAFLNVGELYLHDGGAISSSTFGPGNGGSVVITAQDILLEGLNSAVYSDAVGESSTGNAGSINIETNRLTVKDRALITSAASGFGDAGAINIKADALLVDGGGITSAALSGMGDGGLVSIDARLLEVRNVGSISSSSFSAGKAGTVQVNADRVLLRGGGNIATGGFDTGAGGDVSIVATTDVVVANGFITSETQGPGGAGSIAVATGSLIVRDEGLISSSTRGAGPAGKVTVKASTVTVDSGSQVRSQANNMSTGDAGAVRITTGRLEVFDGSIISSGSFGGHAGEVFIDAKDVVLEAGGIVSRVLQPATGDAGKVSINATNLSLDFGSLISSSTDSVGDAGGVTIIATKVTLDRFSNIESGASRTSSGDSGTVNLTTDILDMKGTSSIITSTLSSGNAGPLVVTAWQAVLENGSNLSSSAGENTAGRAGSIDYRGTSLRLTSGAQISTSTAGTGDAGDIRANVGSIALADGGGFVSNTDAVQGGSSGSVTIRAETLGIETGGLIETNSVNPSAAGAISIVSAGPVQIVGGGAHISSENLSTGGGAAGGIVLTAPSIRLADGGSISTNSVAGAAGDISLFLPRDGYLALEGRDAPGVITTSSGPGTGGRIVISNPLAVISNGGRILALGQQRGANVQLQSDVFIRSSDRLNLLSVDGDLVLDSQVSDVSAGVAVPDISFLDASSVLRGQCPAARGSGLTSQLSLRPFGPYAAPPASSQPAQVSAVKLPERCS